MGTFFYSKHGLGSQGPGGTPPSKPKSSTPPGYEDALSMKLFNNFMLEVAFKFDFLKLQRESNDKF